MGEPKEKHDQSKIKDDGWTKEELEKDQSGNDKQREILEKALQEQGTSSNTDTTKSGNF